MALQDEILKALASGFGMNGLPLYNQETPTNVLTGQPYFRANAPTSKDIGVQPNLSKQISPALAVGQALGSVGNINNQPQFNSREAMNSYNYIPASRNKGEGIQDYVNRLISAPTGAGQLSEKFMTSWAQANKSLPQNKEEVIGASTDNGKTTSDIGSREKSPEIPDVPNTDINYWGVAGATTPETKETDTLPYSNSLQTNEMDTFPYANPIKLGRHELMRLLMRR